MTHGTSLLVHVVLLQISSALMALIAYFLASSEYVKYPLIGISSASSVLSAVTLIWSVALNVRESFRETRKIWKGGEK